MADLKPSRIQRYIGALRASGTISPRILKDKLRKLHALMLVTPENGTLTVLMLKRNRRNIRQHTSVACRPMSLCIHSVSAAIDKPKTSDDTARQQAGPLCGARDLTRLVVHVLEGAVVQKHATVVTSHHRRTLRGVESSGRCGVGPTP